MDTEATRPRARIGFMRRWTPPSRAAVQIDPNQAVAAADAPAGAQALEALRDHATLLRQRQARLQRRPQSAAAAAAPVPAEDGDAPIVPQSMVRRESPPTDSWLKRLFASSRIARYRRLKRGQQVGRHEDISV